MYLFIYIGRMGRKREKHHCVRETSISCLLHTPNWGPGLQPRDVPWLGIKLSTFQFAGQLPAHWVTTVRARIFLITSLPRDFGQGQLLSSDPNRHSSSYWDGRDWWDYEYPWQTETQVGKPRLMRAIRLSSPLAAQGWRITDGAEANRELGCSESFMLVLKTETCQSKWWKGRARNTGCTSTINN